jgi:hypothetical protein
MFTSKNEQNFFLSHIKSNHYVLEYGSGISTTEIAKLCYKLISVEHQNEWYIKLKDQLPNNCTLLFHPPDKEYIEGYDCGTMEQFFSYVNSPIPYKPFDVILIDGRARVSCASISKNIVKDNESIIFIHDWDRLEYQEALLYLDLIDVCETMAKFKIK